MFYRLPRIACLLIVVLVALVALPVQTSAQITVTSTVEANVGNSSAAPLAGLLEFSTDVPTRVSFKIHGPGEAWSVAHSPLTTDHSVPLLGFAPDRDYTLSDITLETVGGETQVLGNTFSFSTDPLPADHPPLIVSVSQPDRMEPGYTILPSYRQVSGGRTSKYTSILDAEGTVRWYMPVVIDDARQLPNGNLFGRFQSAIRETDLLGQVVNSWHGENHPRPNEIPPGSNEVLGLASFHHDSTPLPNGNIVSLSTRNIEIDNFPTDYSANPVLATELITEDRIVEFAPDGQVVHQYFLTDILDPTRIGYGVLRSNNPNDWSHSNAVLHDPRDNSLIISVRHQDAVIKIDRETGALKWILGTHDGWGPEFEPYLLDPVGDPFEWQFHQHSPSFADDGNIILFDNGNFRAIPPDPSLPNSETYTRAVEYAIDEEAMEVRQIWEYGAESVETIFSASRGDADWLPTTDNVLIDFADPRLIDGQSPGLSQSRIMEVTRDGEKVFEVRINYPDSSSIAYRTERIPSLYSSEYLVMQIAVPEPSALALWGIFSTVLFARRRRLRLR